MSPQAVVVGAGVVGLSTAVCFQNRGFDVTIIADRFYEKTTSYVAGGIFLPYNRNVLGKQRRSLACDVVRRSWRHYTSLSENSKEFTGVMKIYGNQCYYTETYAQPLPDDPLCWEVFDLIKPYSIKELKKISPYPCSGWLVQTYVIECKFYLPYLLNKFKLNGGTTRKHHLTNLLEIPFCDVIINCCGLSAADLVSDSRMFPGKGQISHVISPDIKYFHHCEEVVYKPPSERKLCYMIPQSDHVVVGGTYVEHNDSTDVSHKERSDYLQYLSHVAPTIQRSEVVRDVIGIRPCRDELRLEHELITRSTGQHQHVIHNYGHSGNGIALSWGTSDIAAEMANKLFVDKSGQSKL